MTEVTFIRNCIHEALVKGQYSGLDQENLQKKIEEWQKEEPEDICYYRQCTGDEVNVSLESFRKTEQIFASDDEDNEEEKDDEALGTEKNSFLFIHQSKQQQQQLLKKYGELILIDAMYKTTKYAFPLFLLVVFTNVSYVPIAEFIVEAERTENILEALQIIKSWNQSTVLGSKVFHA